MFRPKSKAFHECRTVYQSSPKFRSKFANVCRFFSRDPHQHGACYCAFSNFFILKSLLGLPSGWRCWSGRYFPSQDGFFPEWTSWLFCQSRNFSPQHTKSWIGSRWSDRDISNAPGGFCQSGFNISSEEMRLLFGSYFRKTRKRPLPFLSCYLSYYVRVKVSLFQFRFVDRWFSPSFHYLSSLFVIIAVFSRDDETIGGGERGNVNGQRTGIGQRDTLGNEHSMTDNSFFCL